MARSKYLNPNRFYGNCDPNTHKYVWEDNAARAERLAEWNYLIKHPKKINLDRLVRLHEEMLKLWNNERASFQSRWKELMEEYRRTLNTIEEQEEEIDRLNDVVNALKTQIEEALSKQEQIDNRLKQIEREKEKNAALARRYHNEAISAFNSVANDFNYIKFAGDGEVEKVRCLLQRIDENTLDAGAVQGLSVEVLTKLHAIQKEVTKKRIEFELTYFITKEKAYELKTHYIEWRDNVYFDPQKKNWADMDFWSKKVFSELMQNVDNLCHNIDVAPHSLEIMEKDLRAMQEDIDELQKLGEETVTGVLSASAQSEMAEALGQRTAIVLSEDFCFRTVYMGFNDGDERSAYVVQLENVPSGIRMQFVFVPFSDTQIGCDYSVNFQGYQDEKRVQTIMNSLLSELRLNKVSPSTGEVGESVVDEIEFVPKGGEIHLPEYAIVQQ